MLHYSYSQQRRSNLWSQIFLSPIFHSQNVWQAWHDWDRSFWQDKAEEDRDKRKKPSAHKREWVFPICFWTVLKPLSSLQQFSRQQLLIPSGSVRRLHAQQAEQRKQQIAATSSHLIQHTSHVSTSYKHADLMFFFFFSHAAIEQERKGDATPWLLSTRWKEDEMPEQKALCFDYHSTSISYFVFK